MRDSLRSLYWGQLLQLILGVALLLLGIAGLARLPSSALTAVWIWATLAIGLLGGLGTGALYRAARKHRHPHLARWVDDAVTGYSLRQAGALLQELREFERE